MRELGYAAGLVLLGLLIGATWGVNAASPHCPAFEDALFWGR